MLAQEVARCNSMLKEVHSNAHDLYRVLLRRVAVDDDVLSNSPWKSGSWKDPPRKSLPVLLGITSDLGRAVRRPSPKDRRLGSVETKGTGSTLDLPVALPNSPIALDGNNTIFTDKQSVQSTLIPHHAKTVLARLRNSTPELRNTTYEYC